MWDWSILGCQHIAQPHERNTSCNHNCQNVYCTKVVLQLKHLKLKLFKSSTSLDSKQSDDPQLMGSPTTKHNTSLLPGSDCHLLPWAKIPSKPSIHIIPEFLLDLCFCVQDLIVEMLYFILSKWQWKKENNLFIKWSQDAFVQPRLQPFFDGRSSFQPEVWIPSESMCKSNQLILSEILTSSFRSYIGKIQRHLYKQDWNKIQ